MFELKIETENDAFKQVPVAVELEAIMRDVIHRLHKGDRYGGVYDANGNRVGAFSLEDDVPEPVLVVKELRPQ